MSAPRAGSRRVGIRQSAARGRALLVETHRGSELAAEQLGLSEALVTALDEWAIAVQRINDGERADSTALETISHRGARLAARLAAETGTAVGYVDPVGGRVRRVPVPRTGRRGETGHRKRANAEEVNAPTPWATGLTLSVLVAALVAVALVVVSLGLGEVNPLLAALINLAIAGGFAPSLWLGRRVPTWRWVSLGVATGIVAAWIALLLSLLG